MSSIFSKKSTATVNYVESYNNTGVPWPASGVWDDVTNISLSPGNWMVTGIVDFQNSATATGTSLSGGIGTAAGASTTGLLTGSTLASLNQLPSSASDISVTIPPFRITVPPGPNMTIYLKHIIIYTATTGTPDTVGRISAWSI